MLFVCSVCRMRTPDQHAAMLSHLNAVSWDCVLLENDTQMAFDQFYSVILGILTIFTQPGLFPLLTETLILSRQ